MEQNIDLNTSSHEINVIGRKEIYIGGVKKISSFDHEEFLLETTMGMLLLKGSGLEILKLDTQDGKVRIKGRINSLSYIENGKSKGKEESFMAKLFK